MTSISDLLKKQKVLMDHVPHGHVVKDEHQAQVVAALGIIEETLEFLNAIGFKSWRPTPLSREAQLEEITDVLFFYLEMIITSDFSWEEIETEYHHKWEVNMERYRRAEDGDFSWDKRGQSDGL